MRHRQRKKGRALGPYPDRDGHRVIAVARDGTRASSVVASEAEALALIDELNRQFALEEVTVAAAIDMYAIHLRERGRGVESVIRGVRHLRAFFTDLDVILAEIGPKQAEALYTSLRTRINPITKRPVAVDTHRNALNEAGQFARWALKRKLLAANPIAEVEPVGKRKRGKPQHRVDEARRLLDLTAEAARAGHRGALCVALLILTGARASEIAALVARDVDDDGRLLWMDGKTGTRRIDRKSVV